MLILYYIIIIIFMLMLTEDFYQQSIGRAGLHKQHFFKLNHKHSQPIIVNEKAQWRWQSSSKPIYSVKLTIDIIDSVVILPPSLPPPAISDVSVIKFLPAPVCIPGFVLPVYPRIITAEAQILN